MKTEPIGQCFNWALNQALKSVVDNDMITIYHGKIRQPFSSDPYYDHAWISKNGIIQDWQTMEFKGYGGKFTKIGYPENIFIELFNPIDIKSYHPKEIIRLSHKEKHCGPFSEN